MTGAKYVEAYAGVEDKNGVKVKDWAIQAEPGFVRCSACPGVKLTMLKGKGSLTQRSEGRVQNKKNVSIRALPELGGGFTLARIFLRPFFT